MADIQITKIIVLRGLAQELPRDLDPGELAFTTDEGRMFIGCDPAYGQPQYARDVYPYKNIEILTENATELYSKMHGDRMREGGGYDYYDAILKSDQASWAEVQVDRDGEYHDYRIENLSSVSATIDYAATAQDGTPVRMGVMQLNHYADYEGKPQLTDNCMIRRDMSLVNPSNYEASEVYGSILFRFSVEGPVNSPYLSFQYKNLSTSVLNLRFKVSRPQAKFYDEPMQITPPVSLPPIS